MIFRDFLTNSETRCLFCVENEAKQTCLLVREQITFGHSPTNSLIEDTITKLGRIQWLILRINSETLADVDYHTASYLYNIRRLGQSFVTLVSSLLAMRKDRHDIETLHFLDAASTDVVVTLSARKKSIRQTCLQLTELNRCLHLFLNSKGK